MKKVLFSILIIFTFIIDVNATDVYEMIKVDLSSLNEKYYSTIVDDQLYLYKEDCITNSVNPLENCELYQINENNEIEKTDKKHHEEFYYSPYWYLKTQKNEDGSYDLYTCQAGENKCTLIDNIDVSMMIRTGDSTGGEYSENEYIKLAFYIIKAKDNTVAIYDAKGNKHLDFGNYEILGEIEYSDDGISAETNKLVLKNQEKGSYIFIGENNKVVTLTKEVADKVGVTDENASTITHEINKYYGLGEGYKVKFFTLTDGLINDITSWNGYPKIVAYDNNYIIELVQIWDGNLDTYNLYNLEGKAITSERYNHIYYFDDKEEIILVNDEYDGVIPHPNTKFVKSSIDIHNGDSVIYSKSLENGDYIDEVLIDKDGTIWITTNNKNEEYSRGAIYVLRKTTKSPEKQDDTHSYTIVKGMNNTFKIDSSNFVTFEIDGDFKFFKEVYIDDKLLETTNYTAKEGTTIITLNNDYARKLVDGKNHTIKILFTNGKEVSTTFKVEENIKNPITGQAISILFVIVLIGLAIIVKSKRKSNVLNRI